MNQALVERNRRIVDKYNERMKQARDKGEKIKSTDLMETIGIEECIGFDMVKKVISHQRQMA